MVLVAHRKRRRNVPHPQDGPAGADGEDVNVVRRRLAAVRETFLYVFKVVLVSDQRHALELRHGHGNSGNGIRRRGQ